MNFFEIVLTITGVSFVISIPIYFTIKFSSKKQVVKNNIFKDRINIVGGDYFENSRGNKNVKSNSKK